MTIDKIKANLPISIFNHWTNLQSNYPYNIVKEKINNAITIIEKEIEEEIFGLPRHRIYELKLLKLLNN